MTISPSAAERRYRLRALDSFGDIDVLIVGAGVNGAGLFRDLCEQGLTCLIIDKADYGSGTSAAPSRLIHGGLKYLETGEFGLVAQSVLERNLLLRNAPHYVKPLRTVIPIFSWTKGWWAALRTFFGSLSAPRSRGALLIKLGLMIYDFYGSHHRSMPRHSFAGRRRSLAELPQLTPRIVATGTYYDAAISHPERLVLELVLDGLSASPRSAASNYAQVAATQGGAATISFAHMDGKVTVRPRIVINAAGPWIDQVNAVLGAPSELIGGTKGSHVIIRDDHLVALLDGRMIYFEADDGRICLIYPYLGRILIGSTDIEAADPDNVSCTSEEIDYLLASVRALLPGTSLDRSEIVYAYSGIRPLPNSKGTAPGLISRDHSAPVMEAQGGRPFPIISLVGGKWTTFRGFAADVADDILARLAQARKVSTQDLPIGGGRDFPQGPAAIESWIDRVARATRQEPGRIADLFARFGTRAHTVAEFIADNSPDRSLPGLPDYSYAEIDYILQHEQVETLGDVIFRRTTLGLTGRLSSESVQAIASHLARRRNWSAERTAREIAAIGAKLNIGKASTDRPVLPVM
ncbi:glycerol-3-phosphate dehydrogenase/oxidase [Taklimakanibacter lacteus]|uniref:glycerol-3-phosphate dehydrogenase/oxidase n=1 Tax=Taklimakanibacter lacteus TaxID=2268456 RepID=UPI000E67054F